MAKTIAGLFVAEGTSDAPLAAVVEALFHNRGISIRLSSPDFAQLPKVEKDVGSRLQAGIELMGTPPALVVVHRDADNAGTQTRRDEISKAAAMAGAAHCCPIIPVRMTEAWLLLNEASIRQVAGNPGGKTKLGLPKLSEIERVADPKKSCARPFSTHRPVLDVAATAKPNDSTSNDVSYWNGST